MICANFLLPTHTKISSRAPHTWHRACSFWSCNDLPVTITLSCDDGVVCTCPTQSLSQPHSCCTLPPLTASRHLILMLVCQHVTLLLIHSLSTHKVLILWANTHHLSFVSIIHTQNNCTGLLHTFRQERNPTQAKWEHATSTQKLLLQNLN